jgi:hypothetical protein
MTKGTTAKAEEVDEFRVEMPSGNWVRFRDPDTVTNKERRPLTNEAARAYRAQKGSEDVEAGFSFAQRTAAFMIMDWSYPIPPPAGDPEPLEGLPARDVDLMMKLVMEGGRMSPFLDTGSGLDPKASSSSSAT